MTTIKLKNGSGAPAASDLVQGEPALDLTNKRLYTEDSGGTVIEVGTNPSTLTVDTTTLVVDATNNRVGVGTASPAQALDVVGTIKGDSTFLLSNATTSSFLQVSTNILQFGTSSSDPVAFYANNAERMRIDSSGNVGIGSTNPSVYGKTALVQTTNASTGGLAIVDSTSAQSAKLWCDTTNVYLSSGNTGADPLILNAGGGNVKISTNAGNYTDALLTTRNNGNAIDWGHTNTAGYGSTLGANAGSGAPFVGLSCGAGTNSNTFRTYGIKGSLITTDNAGSLLFSRVTTATADNQSPTESMRIDGSGNLLVNSTSAGALAASGRGLIDVDGTSDSAIELKAGGSTYGYLYTSSSQFRVANLTANPVTFFTNNTERMRIDGSGNVGIGTSSLSAKLSIHNSIATTYSTTGYAATPSNSMLYLHNTHGGSNTASLINFRAGSGDGVIGFVEGGGTNDADFVIQTDGGSNGVERFRISNSGDTFFYANGGELRFTGHSFYRPGASGSGIHLSTDKVLPANENGSVSDNTEDLGSATHRWNDAYITNGVTTGSDERYKQDISALSEAETRVAVACKGLLRKWRWKDRVEAKDNNLDSDEVARFHFGIVAQDLKAAFEAEGLDAGRYGMFMHDTWTDEETGEERDRMGVRYSELLAFIIAAI